MSVTTPDFVRCYRVADILARVQIGKSTFYRLQALGRLPFLEEISPRLGRVRRYRADLVDRYVQNRWQPERRVSGRR